MTIVANPCQFKIPDWFLNRQKDYTDGKYSQVVSNALDMKLRVIWSVWRRFGNFLFAMFLYKLIYMGSSAFTENMFSSLGFLNYLFIHIIICFCHVELKLFLIFRSFSSFVCDEVVQNFRQELGFPWLFPGLAEWVLTLVQWLFTWKNKFPVEIGTLRYLR